MIWRLYSWNVNGLRAVYKKGELQKLLLEHSPHVLCLQEIKIDDEARTKTAFDLPQYVEYFNSGKRKGYAGTAAYIRDGIETPRAALGVGRDEFDNEGRVQTLEFDKFYLVNCYFPNSRDDLSRLDFKIDFNNLLLAEIKKLDKKKPVILTGDYNVAHREIDLARPRENDGEHGFHPREREWFGKLLDAGFVDTFRHLHPDKVQYTWWSMRFGARKRNVGWRIDYFVVSERLADNIRKAEILDQIQGSDHCPVTLEIEI